MIKFYSKDTALALSDNENEASKAESITIGNPYLVYQHSSEKHAIELMLKMEFIHKIYGAHIKEKQSITLMELACGNGVNSRVLILELLKVYPDIKVHVILVDVVFELLDEALIRWNRLIETDSLSAVTVEAVQVNMLDDKALLEFQADYYEQVDIVFSIKFINNTNVKVTGGVARFLGNILVTGGGVIIQSYNETNKIKAMGKLIASCTTKKYGNSVWLDRIIMRLRLSRSGLCCVYRCVSKVKNGFRLNHFYDHQVEDFFVKR